ncbi:DUF4982 domain-containing protein [Paraglaciecola aquimarina]|uniref:DUF4982 domain-containing protein n=1 Tax=Paraglaciecola aquimarina TaxID=1235557 RepID=A0ABU3SYN3_9ALTE|nr:DUF4982 domain-containing protein [Paraglaciecola aquimarina]MDU0355118.1 DUF4982 domain-containing protein [Paraglaciecola aquimarina]
MLDLAGFTKPSYHMMKTIWSEEPHIYISTQPLAESVYTVLEGQVVEKETGNWKRAKWGWRPINKHWNYPPKQNIVVEVYTNQQGVELFLNDSSLGVQYLQDNPDHILKWSVPYSAGTLTAKALDSQITTSLDTAGEPVSIQLNVDKNSLSANRYDVAHVTAQLIDKNGNPVYHHNKSIEFTINGALTRLGVDNGASDNIQKHQTNTITTVQGRALLIVQSKDLLGQAQISASLNGKISSTLAITIE